MTSEDIAIPAVEMWENFKVSRIEPFPFSIHGSIIVLDLSSPIVLVHKDVRHL